MLLKYRVVEDGDLYTYVYRELDRNSSESSIEESQDTIIIM